MRKSPKGWKLPGRDTLLLFFMPRVLTREGARERDEAGVKGWERETERERESV